MAQYSGLELAVGTHAAARLTVLRGMVQEAGGRDGWEAVRNTERTSNHVGTVKMTETVGDFTIYYLSCGHSHTEQGADDGEYSLVGAEFNCLHPF